MFFCHKIVKALDRPKICTHRNRTVLIPYAGDYVIIVRVYYNSFNVVNTGAYNALHVFLPPRPTALARLMP